MASTAPSPPRRHPFSKKKPRATASLLLSFVVVVASAFIVVVVEGSEHPASSVNANAASVVADRRGGRRSARSPPPPPRRVAFAPSPAAIAVGRTDRRPFRRGTGIVMSERGGGSGEGEEGTTTKTTVPESCDYLVVGGGATGMSFVDTLLAHHPEVDPPLQVAMVDARDAPGGQWHDGYKFVRLHQPSSMYGVETAKLEPEEEGEEGASERHRATREEILEYYDGLRRAYEKERGFAFLGGRTFDFDEMTKKDRPDDGEGILCELKPVSSPSSSDDGGGVAAHAPETILVKRRIVDARFLEPDLPIHVPPKFAFDGSVVRCVPVNSIVEPDDESDSDSPKRTKRYVVIGAGKTGMDALTYLQTSRNVDPDDVVWVVPNDPWITAREDIGGCMEFLHSCLTLAERKRSEGEGDERSMKEMVASQQFLQDGFLEWERRGKIYRLDEDALPTKFKDATLDRDELNLIRRVANVVRRGRVKEIRNDGSLVMEDGTTVNLPWKEEEDDDFDVDDVTFVHCSAGAFHYSKQPDEAPPPFAKDVITIQDVYGTPGFCFVGSIFAMLECLDHRLSDEEKNAMCLSPQRDAEEARLPLGPSGGDVGILSRDHGYVQRASNLRKWLKDPDVRSWLVGHRLFNLGKYGADEMEGMVEEIWDALEESDLVEKE